MAEHVDKGHSPARTYTGVSAEHVYVGVVRRGWKGCAVPVRAGPPSADMSVVTLNGSERAYTPGFSLMKQSGRALTVLEHPPSLPTW